MLKLIKNLFKKSETPSNSVNQVVQNVPQEHEYSMLYGFTTNIKIKELANNQQKTKLQSISQTHLEDYIQNQLLRELASYLDNVIQNMEHLKLQKIRNFQQCKGLNPAFDENMKYDLAQLSEQLNQIKILKDNAWNQEYPAIKEMIDIFRHEYCYADEHYYPPHNHEFYSSVNYRPETLH